MYVQMLMDAIYKNGSNVLASEVIYMYVHTYIFHIFICIYVHVRSDVDACHLQKRIKFACE